MSSSERTLEQYDFPLRVTSGVLLGLSGPRVTVLAAGGAVLVAAMTLGGRAFLIAVPVLALVALVATVRVGGRVVIEWLPLWSSHAVARLRRTDSFRAEPAGLDDVPDLPGELWGLGIVAHSTDDLDAVNPTAADVGVVHDVTNSRHVALAEVSAGDFLFLDDDVQQQRVSAWGTVLDHISQVMPELCRIQLVHAVGPESVEALSRHHERRGGHGPDDAAASYRDLLDTAGTTSQAHRLFVAIALDERAARRAIRQAGGGTAGAVTVLCDRAAQVEDALRRAGLVVHGWLPARRIAEVIRTAYDPLARLELDDRPDDVHEGGGVAVEAAGPAAVDDGWWSARHDSGYSTTLQVIRPPTRPVTGDFLQHLLVGVAAERRLSLLFHPQSSARAERTVQAQQVSNASDQQLRRRWGFTSTARQERELADARRREEDVAAGRTVMRVIWLVTVVGTDLDELESGVGQVEAAARRCGLELRRMAGLQRQAAAWTLPLCRGDR